MDWGGGGPAEEVIWAGQCGKATREVTPARVAVAGGSAGAGGGGDGVVSGGTAAVRSCFLSSPAVRWWCSVLPPTPSLAMAGHRPFPNTRSDRNLASRGLSENRPCPRVPVNSGGDRGD
jgi:hypothetical protein